MRITKFGHCFLLIEVRGIRIVIDPGNYCPTPHLTGVNAILITHEHEDHCSPQALRRLITNNPDTPIYTHAAVKARLLAEGIPSAVVSAGETLTVGDIAVRSVGTRHACIHPDFPAVPNTGYLIDHTFFYPGDALTVPPEPVALLALPVSAPWLKISESIEYAKAVKPRVVLPVHDGMLRQDYRLNPTRHVPKTVLEPIGIRYHDMREGDAWEWEN